MSRRPNKKIMSIFERKTGYDDKIEFFEAAKAAVAHTNRADYSEAQKRIDRAGIEIIRFERKTGISEARRALADERILTARIAEFQGLVAHYAGLNAASEELVDGLATGRIAPDQIELHADNLEDFGKVLVIAKATLARLLKSLDEVAVRKARLSKSALLDAAHPDPLSESERSMLTAFYHQEISAKPTPEVTEESLAPLSL